MQTKKNREIKESYLFFNNPKDFTNTIMKKFFNRLLLFLKTSIEIQPPNVIVTSDKDTMIFHYGEKLKEYPLAWYDEDENIILFNADKYLIDSRHFVYKNVPNISDDINRLKSNYKYCIPFSDIYHESIHCVQYQCGMYNYTDFIEGCDEIATYIFTGHLNISYNKESISIWVLSRKILKLDIRQFYYFIIDAIINNNFIEKYLLSSPKIIKLISENHNYKVENLLSNIVQYYDSSYSREFENDIKKIYDLIFYKF